MTPRRRRQLLIALAAAALLALVLAPAALAAAGGGSAGFSGGGEGGGGFGGGGGGGGGGHNAFEIYLIFRVLLDVARLGHGLGLLVLIALALVYWFMRDGAPKVQAFFAARRQRGHSNTRETKKRARKVQLAAAVAADENSAFDPDHVKVAAASLFTSIQFAWDADNRIALRGLVAPDLLVEWERRLDDLQSKGWRNHVELQNEPQVEYVGLARRNRHDTSNDQVVVRIDAKLKDYVVDRNGRHIKRRGQMTETVRLREYWTLQRRGDHWILASIEQGAEGAHVLTDAVIPSAEYDTQALRDESMVEGAVADAAPDGTKVSELAPLDYAGDAHAAANDLSLADGRFAPDVLEIAARRAVDAWAQAVDGADDALRTVATSEATQQLLHPNDPSGRTRIVVRGAHVNRITIVALDAHADPATMTVDVDITGRRYLEDRDTTRVLAGNQNRATDFTERWTFAVTGDATNPWRIVAVQTAALRA
jgi:predicted lipid-binding transport protein (Tim44 family)